MSTPEPLSQLPAGPMEPDPRCAEEELLQWWAQQDQDEEFINRYEE